MKRTTTPTGWPAKAQATTPTKAKVLKALGRTAKWLRDTHTIKAIHPKIKGKIPMVFFQEPMWKGWVLGFHHDGEMFLCVPFREHITMVYKLTPAGWAMKVPPAVLMTTLTKRRKLAAKKGYSL